MPQSYKKLNSKLYLKKNVIPNLSSFNEININSNSSNTQLGTKSNMNTETNNSRNKLYKNKPDNMKFHIGKNNSSNHMKDSSANILKKSVGSASELFGNSVIKKTKTKQKNCSDLDNININQINPLGYILNTSSGINNSQFFSPQNGLSLGQKIIFLKNEKNKIKDKYIGNISKDSLKVIKTQGNNQSTNNLDDKNGVQYLLRNTYNNVKIYPTTFLNNKIIYQSDNNIKDNNNIHFIKNKSEKILINKNDNIKNNKNNTNLDNAKSIEEVHFLYVNTIQNGKNLILKWDKCNN